MNIKNEVMGPMKFLGRIKAWLKQPEIMVPDHDFKAEQQAV